MIDKNIRLEPHHSRDLLVGRRSDNKRPKYQPPSQGGGFANVGGGGDGNQGWQTYAIAPKAPTKRPSIMDKDPAEITREVRALQDKVKTFDQDFTAKDYVDLDKYMEDKGLYPQQDLEILPDTGEKDWEQLEKEQIERDWRFEDLKAKEPTVPPKRYKTVTTRHPEVDDVVPTEIRDFYSPTGYQDLSRATTGTMGERTWGEQAEAGIKRDGIMGMLGKIAPFLLPALLPAKLGQLYSGYNQAKTLSRYAKQFGITDKDIMSSLTSDLTSKSNIRNLLSRKTTTDVKDDGFRQGDIQEKKIKAPKDVITAGIEKFIPSKEQLTEVRRKRDILQGYADKGALNERGQNTLLQMNQFLEKYLVPVAHGGFIDKPLIGRSRDI